MLELGLAVAFFLATHLLAAVGPLRRALVGALGERPYMIGFSVVSLGALFWLGAAYAAAPCIEVWPYAPELRWLPLAAMPVACLLLAAGMTSRNPFSLGAGGAGFDPAAPGVVRLTRHPAVWGLVIWSASHVPVNGDAAGLVLFGLLTALGLAGPVSLDAKRRASLGAEEWRAQLERVRETSRWTAVRQMGAGRVALGAVLYVALLVGHEAVIGISALPP
ncbi:MAG: NnrU family protein [Magnetovibrio sp.]|nr:NnrU family protein [Magnetovibrio sp.]